MAQPISSRFQQIHPLFYRILVLTGITLCVYLSFQYLLPLALPFLLAYLFMRMLFPITRFFKRKFHFPSWLAHATSLGLFFSVFLFGCWFLFSKLWQQFQLLLQNFPSYREHFSDIYATQSGRICHDIDTLFSMNQGTSSAFLEKQMHSFGNTCQDFLSTHAGSWLGSCVFNTVELITIIVVVVISMILLCKDMAPIHMAYHKSPYYDTFHKVALTLKKSGLSYLKSQIIIILYIWFLCGCGLVIIGNPYPLLIGLCIAIMDAFPVLGSGLILVPWGIYHLFQGNYFSAAVLFIIFLLAITSRELLEAKLMGNNLGLLPFFMTASIYIGILLFGVCGIFLGPFGVILIRCIYTLVVPSA